MDADRALIARARGTRYNVRRHGYSGIQLSPADMDRLLALAEAGCAVQGARDAADLWNEIGRIEGEMLSNESCEAIARTLAAARADGTRRGLAAAAGLVETWADDHLTIQPSFTRMTAAIRALDPAQIAAAEPGPAQGAK